MLMGPHPLPCAPSTPSAHTPGRASPLPRRAQRLALIAYTPSRCPSPPSRPSPTLPALQAHTRQKHPPALTLPACISSSAFNRQAWASRPCPYSLIKTRSARPNATCVYLVQRLPPQLGEGQVPRCLYGASQRGGPHGHRHTLVAAAAFGGGGALGVGERGRQGRRAWDYAMVSGRSGTSSVGRAAAVHDGCVNTAITKTKLRSTTA